jgi:hypothetical protein
VARSTAPGDLVVTPPALSGEELLAAQRAALDAVEQDERDRARLYARTARNRAEVARLWAAKPGQGVMELAGTARIGQDRATTQTLDGLRLVECFPRVLQLLDDGRMRQGTAELLLAVTKNLSASLQARVGAHVADDIAGLDAADARQVVVAAVAELQDEQEAKAAHEKARAARGVWVKPVEDGMARIGAEVDQIAAHRFALDLDELDRLQKRADESAGRVRTTQQRRADLLAELPGRCLALLRALQRAGGTDDEELAALLALPIPKPTTMHVHIPVTTVLDLDRRSGHVEGLGVVPAFQARLLRPVASLARLWVDERTGVPLAVDPEPEPPPAEPRDPDHVRRRLLSLLRPTAIRDDAEPHHHPSRALRRLVQVRDLHCDGPGCPRSAHACELDHGTAWAQEGPTGVWNLFARSTRCHHAKHDGWTVVRHPDGSSTWTSPTGRTYGRRGPWRRIAPPGRDLPEPSPDTLDDTDPREDWHRPLWPGDEPPPF